MLYLEADSAFIRWTGEVIGDIRYPTTVETMWSSDDLAAIGLFIPVTPEVPAGKVVISQSVQRVDGVVTVVYELADIPVTADDVWAEKDRRLALGFEYTFPDARGMHHIGTTATDMAGWDEVDKFAQALLDTGAVATSITIMTNTGVVQVLPIEWKQIVLGVAAYRQPIWAASFALAAQDPIPADYATNEAYWSAP